MPRAPSSLAGGLGHADHTRLGSGVVDLAVVSGERRNRSDVDNAALLGAHHHRTAQAEHVECALEVGADNGIELVLLHADHQTVAGDARIVDENERYADLFLNFLESGAAGVIVRNIPLLHISVDAVRAALLRHSLSLFDRGRTIDEDVEAVLRQLFRRLPRQCRGNRRLRLLSSLFTPFYRQAGVRSFPISSLSALIQISCTRSSEGPPPARSCP